MSNFKNIDRDTSYLLPPSIRDWLPDNHLARFVADVVAELDLRPFREAYRSGGGGSTAYDPSMLLAMLFYGYATGVYSSRKLEKASYESIPMRYICGNAHPDHDTIASFRKRFLKELGGCFVQILVTAKELEFLKLGNVSIDGTKIKANASKHSAMSFGYAEELEKRLQVEVDQLLRTAQEIDENENFEPDIPKELENREKRLARIREAKQAIKERAKERDKANQSTHDEKLAERKLKEERTGKKPGGKPPAPPKKGPQSKDQYNFTDPESAIMKTGSFGYFSKENIDKSADREVEVFIATGRQPHNPSLEKILKQRELPDLANIVTEGLPPKEAMKIKLNTKEGHELYRLRKCTVEPVFGIIKEALGFRQFLLRGVRNVQGEWCLVCTAFNLKRIHSMMVSA